MGERNFVAEIPIGRDGLTGTKNLSNTTPGQLLRALNITYENGTLQKEPGAIKYNASAISGTPHILGGWDWRPSAAFKRTIIVNSDGKALKDDGTGAFGTTLATGLTISTNDVPVFVEGGKEAAAQNRKLFIYTAGNQVKVLSGDGGSISSISSPPADWTSSFPIGGFNYVGRHWGYGNPNDPHRLYASLTTDHENFTTSPLTFSIFPGEGDRIACALPYKGLIIIWKYPVGIYYLDARDATTANWTVQRVSTSLGMAGPLGAVPIDDDILFVDAAGNVQLLSFALETGNLGGSSLSQQAEIEPFIRENFNTSRVQQIRGIYYPAKRQAHLAWAGIGQTINDRRLVVDFTRPNFPRFRFSDWIVCQSLWLRVDDNNVQRPTAGDDAGFVWKLDDANRAKDGQAYNCEFQIPHTDFDYVDPALATRRKNGQFLEVVMDPKGEWDLSCDILWDGSPKHTVQFNMGGSGAVIGTFTLGTDRLGGDIVLNKRRKIWGSGRRFSIIGRLSGVSQDFSISRFYFHGTVGDDRT